MDKRFIKLKFFVFLELGVIPNISLHFKSCLLCGGRGRGQHQCDAQLLCLDWEFLTGEAPRGKEESSAPFIVVPVMLWAVFPSTAVNWEPCFTINPTRSVSCGTYGVLDHLTKTCSMKNLI